MKVILFLSVCLYMSWVSDGRQLSRCEFFRLAKAKLNGVAGASAEHWTCLVQFESGFRTDAVNNNGGKSRDYGPFQINSKYWCNDGKTAGATNGCRIECNKLLDDNLDDDFACARKIAEQAKGLSPWYGWKKGCKGKDVRKYGAGC